MLDGLCPLINSVYTSVQARASRQPESCGMTSLDDYGGKKKGRVFLNSPYPELEPLHTRRLMLVDSVGSLAQQGGLLLSEAYHVPYYKSTRSSSSILNITDNLFLDSLGFN